MKRLVLASLGLLLAAGLSTLGLAATADQVDVTVTVPEFVAVDVHDAAVSITLTDPTRGIYERISDGTPDFTVTCYCNYISGGYAVDAAFTWDGAGIFDEAGIELSNDIEATWNDGATWGDIIAKASASDADGDDYPFDIRANMDKHPAGAATSGSYTGQVVFTISHP